MLKTEKKNHHLQTRVDYLQYENSRLNQLLACHGISPSAKSSPQIRLRRNNSVCSENDSDTSTVISENSDLDDTHLEIYGEIEESL